ncbi:MAG: exodeoxyribonuclease V subunit gamma [Polyangiales bacterium]
MIQLVYGNRMEALVGRLGDDLAAHRREHGPFDAPRVVFAHPNLERWALQRLARELGIVANLRTSRLERLIRGTIEGLGDRVRLLERVPLEAALLSVLGDPHALEEGGEVLAPVRRYVAGDASGKKRLGLAAQLATLFDEYALSRPTFLPAWRAGRPVLDDRGDEPWQRHLAREALARLDATGVPHRTLEELVLEPIFDEAELPTAVYVFGLGPHAGAYRTALARMAERTTVRVYALNPCREHWDDVLTDRERERALARLGGGAGEPGDDPYHLLEDDSLLLRRFGRPGRETVRLLNELVDCDFESAFDEPTDDSVLSSLKGSVLSRARERLAEGRGADSSLQIVRCSSRRREAEVVASDVWDVIARHEGEVRFSDVAVLVPPGEEAEYEDALRIAFRETQRIPLRVPDGRSVPAALVLEGASALLSLPGTAMTRADVLHVLRQPAILARFPTLDADRATRLVADAGIAIGASHDALAGTYVDRPLFTFAHGLDRIAASLFMDEGEVELHGERFPVLPIEAEGADVVLVLSSLIADARRLAATRATLDAWVPLLVRYLSSYLGAPDEDAARTLDSVLGAVRSLADLAPEALASPSLGAEAALDRARRAVESIETASRALDRGVVFGTLASLRGIPFHTIYVLGLGEGAFPSTTKPSPLDLRALHRLPGDVTETEKDRYLFLEALLSADRRLVATYVGREPVSGEPLEPSSVLLDLRDSLPATWWAGAHVVAPHTRHDAANFDRSTPLSSHAPRALREREAADVGAALRSALSADLPFALGRLPVDEAVRERLAALVPTAPLPPPPPTDRELRATLPHLVAFLRCGVQGSARLRLGLREEREDEDDSLEGEPLTLERLEARRLVEDALVDHLSSGVDPLEAWARRYDRLVVRARAPYGPLAKRSAVEARDELEGLSAQLAAHGITKVEVHRFGTAKGEGLVTHRHPPLRLHLEVDGTKRLVSVHGTTALLAEPGYLVLGEGGASAEASARKLGRRLLLPFVSHVVRLAAGLARGPCVVLPLRPLAKGASPAPVLVPSPSTREDAIALLEAWLADLLGPLQTTFLPIEAIVEGKLEPTTLEEFRDELLEKGGSCSSAHGPVPGFAEWDLPADPRALAERRIAPLLPLFLRETEARA